MALWRYGAQLFGLAREIRKRPGGGLGHYLRVFKKDGGLRAEFVYYRANALSAQQNRDLAAKGKLAMPVLALGSDQGSIPDMASPRGYSRRMCKAV